ncbi:hypothetical protein FOQG_11688 [Fusarium oxysporum f. sp. raphani 54005]|uniref:Uncharacterized protein n=6 Tax=Fusarium oxysporum TaxID=5507 RepID=W9IZJ8_FUSOX|nr:hypothetical protein FOXG_18262 [Fusarium oxysporum f. sp. lycopersici 4287]EWY97911.1 hypothetical protein FOYG_02642 [Fusarium oxysporum NRRL 32931]EXA49271.1 hypothetical protein FOVG_02513 [Fusarium oxysporum f. sp. pisi HDV247]EXK41354.1 hypothetical protein FOMG_04808 [Fusarium oxysporum f. sp. melonis 26406]EXK84206.1 hypothetical protein FOQG_11688 [Fusarium oxysporum f. sp. raphani 54005]EXM37292.1 hypothetical protein FOTG_01047 [Fusarium oxysporum f. sp. vasinfectum 25433]
MDSVRRGLAINLCFEKKCRYKGNVEVVLDLLRQDQVYR